MLGQLAAYITSEEFFTVAGNTEEISSVLGHLDAHITSEDNAHFRPRKFPRLIKSLNAYFRPRKFPLLIKSFNAHLRKKIFG